MNPIETVTNGVTTGAKSVLNVKNIIILILTALVLYLLAKRFMKETIVLEKNNDGTFSGTVERKLQFKRDPEPPEPEDEE